MLSVCLGRQASVPPELLLPPELPPDEPPEEPPEDPPLLEADPEDPPLLEVPLPLPDDPPLDEAPLLPLDDPPLDDVLPELEPPSPPPSSTMIVLFPQPRTETPRRTAANGMARCIVGLVV